MRQEIRGATANARDVERRHLGRLLILGFVRISRPASGRARLAAHVRGSAAVEQDRPHRRNPPPIPVCAACLRQTAPDAGLRAYLKSAFLQTRKDGRPLVAPTKSR